MKTFLITLLLGLMGGLSYAQTTQVKIGRHGACNTGRGICGIQYQPTAKAANNNAVFLKDSDGNTVLRLYKSKLSGSQIDMLFGKHIESTTSFESLQIDLEFNLDWNTTSWLYNATGTHLTTINATSFEALISDHYIDVILLKSKS